MTEINIDSENDFAFGTKAETLARLWGCLQTALLCDQYYFTESQWHDDRAHVLDATSELFAGLRIVVRSSAIQEDGADHSMAGEFLSVIGVSADDTNAVISAIEKVSESYLEYRSDNQFLIQPLVERVTLSGVATSRDVATGAPYFMINYDDFSDRTDSVTGGAKSKTIAVLRIGIKSLQSPRIAAVVAVIQELEQVTDSDLLDVEFCITNGIVPFSVLARHAFVAVSFLRSMVSRGLLTEIQDDAFFGSIRTVAYDFVHDLWLFSESRQSKEDFMKRYGHLRPGTYDITSPRYDEMPPGYLSGKHSKPKHVGEFTLSPVASRAIDRCLEEQGFSVGSEVLFEYMGQAIRFRELSKFLFTQTVSNIINTLSSWGEALGLDRDELTFLSFDEILSDLPTTVLRERIAQAKDTYLVTQAVRLPHLIVEPSDVDVVNNFLTMQTAA